LRSAFGGYDVWSIDEWSSDEQTVDQLAALEAIEEALDDGDPRFLALSQAVADGDAPFEELMRAVHGDWNGLFETHEFEGSNYTFFNDFQLPDGMNPLGFYACSYIGVDRDCTYQCTVLSVQLALIAPDLPRNLLMLNIPHRLINHNPHDSSPYPRVIV
jgi:hypothetical protein